MFGDYTSMGSFQFNGFGRAMHGLDTVTDPLEIADRIEEHLVWMAVAGEANHENEKSNIQVSHLYRAYPSLLEDNIGAPVPLDEAERVEMVNREIVPRLRKIEAAVGLDKIKEAINTDDAVRGFEGLVNEEVLGHPLQCCTYQPNTQSFGPIGDVWQSVGKLGGRLYDEYNRVHRRPGGKLLLYQTVLFEHASGKLLNPWRVIQEVGPNRYVPLLRPREDPLSAEEIQGYKKAVDSAYALALRRRYDWEVEFALGKERTGLVITTDAEGAREMLANREKAPRKRRAALIHWVREHWRKGRTTAPTQMADPVLIKSHMRGKIECDYGGMYCRIYPSRYDLDRSSNQEKIERRLEGTRKP